MTTDSLNKTIHKLYETKLRQKVLNIQDKSKGCENKVFIVKTNKGESVFRIPVTGELQARREVWASKAWAKISIPVPRILVYDWSKKLVDFDYIIESKIDGDDLEDTKLSKTQLEQVMKDLGKMLRKMHKVKTKQFGFLNKPLTGEFKNMNFLIEWVEDNLKKLAARKTISISKIRKIKKYFGNNKDVLNCKISRLLHNDLAYSNCVLNNKKLEGIIDLGDAFAGDPVYDVARSYQALTELYPDKIVDIFLDAYGKVNMHRFNFYLLYHATWTADVYVEEGNVKNISNSVRLINKVLKQIPAS